MGGKKTEAKKTGGEATGAREMGGKEKGGSILAHVGINNVEREGTTAVVRKYRQLVRTLKQTRIEQIIMSGILPVMGSKGHIYRRMAINTMWRVYRFIRKDEGYTNYKNGTYCS